MEKSAEVHAGLLMSVRELKLLSTTAVRLVTVIGPEFGLSKLPLRATAAPPGVRFVDVAVWLTVSAVGVPTPAEPVPLPPPVQ